jgi:orotidine-5'-phosphate decarboxylase
MLVDPKHRVIVPLDRPDLSSALALVDSVGSHVGAFKVGLELFTAVGPEAVRAVVSRGYRVFLDCKFHDIPNTAAGACRSAVRTGAWMLNVHASGGRVMLEASARAVQEEAMLRGCVKPILIGVTVLTSLDRAILAETLGVDTDPAELVMNLSRLCQDCGLDGVVTSPQEAQAIRQVCGPGFVIVTPGIRRAGGAVHDQRRIATPSSAFAGGADYLVIGRDITAAAEPAQAADEIAEDLRLAGA